METEDKLKQMVEGVKALRLVLDVAATREIAVPNVHALLDRTLADIDALCAAQLAPREVAS